MGKVKSTVAKMNLMEDIGEGIVTAVDKEIYISVINQCKQKGPYAWRSTQRRGR